MPLMLPPLPPRDTQAVTGVGVAVSTRWGTAIEDCARPQRAPRRGHGVADSKLTNHPRPPTELSPRAAWYLRWLCELSQPA